MLKRIREKPVVWIGVPVVGLLLVVWLVTLWINRGNGREGVLVYWYDPAAAALIAAPADARPGEGYFRAKVFYCSQSPDKHFPGSLSRQIGGRDEISGINPVAWVGVNSPAADVIFESLSQRCAGQGSIMQWYALDHEG